MADYYVEYIAEGLKVLNSDLQSSSFRNYWNNNGFFPWNWDDFFTALAWQGLTKTEEWNALSDDLKN